MAGIVHTKQGRDREDKPRNVKKKGELPPLEMVMITNMELFCLNVCWSSKRQRDFKMANLYGFFKWSSNLPLVDTELVEEFVRTNDPKDGSSVVKDRNVGIQAKILHQALYLPICKLSIGMEASENFKPELHFKIGVGALAKGQGWKVMEALTPEAGEWNLRFVQKRLTLNRHTTNKEK